MTSGKTYRQLTPSVDVKGVRRVSLVSEVLEVIGGGFGRETRPEDWTIIV